MWNPFRVNAPPPPEPPKGPHPPFEKNSHCVKCGSSLTSYFYDPDEELLYVSCSLCKAKWKALPLDRQ